MARNLTFSLNGADYAAAPVKIERRKLYGWSDTLALDDDGKECRVVSMDEAGTLIIPRGGLGLGSLSPDGEWVDQSSLKAVNAEGREAALIKSSYGGVVALERAAGAEELLSHNITAVYQLDGVEADFIQAVGDGVHTFVYSYRDAYEGSPAFILANEGALFMLVGCKTDFEMISLAETRAVEEADEEDTEEEESDDIDFSMGL